MGSWETHIQGAALVAGEDLPHALAHALGAPQLGFLSRPLHRGSERGGVDLGRHGYESRVVAALRVSRRRVAAADADAAECLSPRDSPPLTARPATMRAPDEDGNITFSKARQSQLARRGEEDSRRRSSMLSAFYNLLKTK